VDGRRSDRKASEAVPLKYSFERIHANYGKPPPAFNSSRIGRITGEDSPHRPMNAERKEEGTDN
jgi:hypothetical protein